MRIRECTAADLERLEQVTPHRHPAERFERQQRGECAYLVAWDGAEPVGDGKVLWRGAKIPNVRTEYPECPEINGLVVYRTELRGRGIGSALVLAAEDRARARGFQRIGLGAGHDNPRTARLYERPGYEPGIHYVDVWTYEDDAGVEHVVEEPCTFMVKYLAR